MMNDAVIREYLLGRLDDDLELVSQIDEQVFTDPDFSITVSIVEDEIIEEYLEGALSAEDKQAVEYFFLLPPERQQKLRATRLLTQRLQAAQTKKADQAPNAFPGQAASPHPETYPGPIAGAAPSPARIFVMPSVRSCIEIAAAALFAVTILYLAQQRRTLETAVQQSNQQLRELTASLNHPTLPALQILEPSAGTLSLTETSLTRGSAALPEVKVSITAAILHAEAAIAPDPATKNDNPAGLYRVQVEQENHAIWTKEKVTATAVQGGAVLKVDLPSDALRPGMLALVLTNSNGKQISYPFVVSQIH